MTYTSDTHALTCADECDRCGAQDGRTVHVGHEPTLGFDGLCDACLDLLTATPKG